MTSEDAPPRLLPRRPVLVDGVAVLLVLVAEFWVAPVVTGRPAASGAAAVLVVLSLSAVPLRSRRPVLALVLATAAAAVLVLLRGVETFAALAPLATLYSVAVSRDRRVTVVAWAATTTVVLAAAAAASVTGPGSAAESLQVLPWTAVAAALGDALRNRRAYVAAIQERAVRAERSREQEALRRVAEERVRIARELHDVLAHHIAVVSVQAGVAQHLLTDQPELAGQALVTVRRSAAAVLDELSDILAVLREPGEQVHVVAPAPGLARLEPLVASFTDAGLAVDWSLQGRPRDLAPSVDLVAYRVLEEGLTNALKHGSGAAHLTVGYGDTVLTLRVENHVADPGRGGPDRRSVARERQGGSGQGLVGMRERAAAVGGRLSAAPTAAGFCVEAELPLRVLV